MKPYRTVPSYALVSCPPTEFSSPPMRYPFERSTTCHAYVCATHPLVCSAGFVQRRGTGARTCVVAKYKQRGDNGDQRTQTCSRFRCARQAITVAGEKSLRLRRCLFSTHAKALPGVYVTRRVRSIMSPTCRTRLRSAFVQFRYERRRVRGKRWQFHPWNGTRV